MITGKDWAARLVEESEDLNTRVRRLKGMLEARRMGTLDFEPNCPEELLVRQLNAMEDYAACLRERMELEL